MHDVEANLGMNQGNALDGFHTVAELGPGGTQELTTYRQVVEQRANVNLSTGRSSGIGHALNLSAIDLQPSANGGVRLASGQGEARYRRNRRQSLAAKAKRQDIPKVLSSANLAGRMTLNAQQSVFSAHTRAIVDHANQSPPTGAQLYANVRGTGVDRILDQLLHHRSGPFNDLSRSNLVDQAVV
jgi:hypothetical protein